MEKSGSNKLVYTIRERCRVCYTCVRECPAKAIRIANGQAEVIHERCIGCGNCIKVCSQDAKVSLDTSDEVKALLNSGEKVVAMIAPSFPAEFSVPEKIPAMIRALGFDHVVEVAFGADLVAREYSRLYQLPLEEGYISSDCPAIAFYIRQYYPELARRLAPVVSPMVCMARVVRKKWGEDTKVVFIGPCIAKKAESDEVNTVITFRELRKLFGEKKIREADYLAEEFDPPLGGKGALFPLNQGLLQTAGLTEDLLEDRLIVAEGRLSFQQAIKELYSGDIHGKHLELLCCEGCIMGPGMSPGGRKFSRRSSISNYVRNKLNHLNGAEHEAELSAYSLLNLGIRFNTSDRRIPQPSEAEVDKILLSMGKQKPSDLLNCGACGYDTCRDHAIAIIEGLAESEMCLPLTIEKLHKSVRDLAVSKDKMYSLQQALRQSEKLAHMGQLSAGIAHELNNPLGVIIMYCNLLLDECPPESPIRKDLELISEQGDRCKKIVGGLLNFARKNQVNSEAVDILDLCRKCSGAVLPRPGLTIQITDRISDPVVWLDSDQMIQVVSNLLKNAVDAIPADGQVEIIVTGDDNTVNLAIKDNGTGISEEHLPKLYEPFFTTKPTGVGTGLGLPIVYGIVKMHKGRIEVVSNADPKKGPTGTTFTLSLPRNKMI